MNRTRFFSVFLCLIAVVVTLAIIVLNGSEYETLFLLPLTYAASVFFVSLDSKRRNSFTYWAVVIVSFIRYVVCPFFEVIAGSLDDPSRLFSSNAVMWTPILMSVELIAVLLFYSFFSRTKELKNCLSERDNSELRQGAMYLSGNRNAYYVFCLIAFAVFGIWGTRSGAKISFLFIDAGTKLRVGDNESTFASFTSMALCAGLVFAFLSVIDISKNSPHNPTGNYRLAVFSGLLIILVIVGERRTPIFYNSFVVAFLLSRLFPQKGKKLIRFILIASLGVLSLMTVYKVLNAFAFDSYATALSKSSFGVKGLAGQLDAYFTGPKNVMINLAFAEVYDGSALRSFLFDIFRSTFGISYLFKGKGMTLSEQYNSLLYHGSQLNGYLLSSLGYGTIVFGKIIGPIFTVVRLAVAMLFERLMLRARSYEYMYLFAYFFISNALFFFTSFVSQISTISRMLICYSFIIMCASVLKKREPKKNK